MAEWRLWQLIDAAFPTGSFAHSFGLEAAVQGGWVSDNESLHQAIRQQLQQQAALCLPFVEQGFTGSQTIDQVLIDCDVRMRVDAANRASYQQGRALLSALIQCTGDEVLASLKQRLLTMQLPCHLAPLWGLALRQLGFTLSQAQSGLLQTTLRDVISAAVRLGVCGPFAGQRLQWQLAPYLEHLLQSYAQITQPMSTAPLIDLYQSQHDRLYSRLFHS